MASIPSLRYFEGLKGRSPFRRPLLAPRHPEVASWSIEMRGVIVAKDSLSVVLGYRPRKDLIAFGSSGLVVGYRAKSGISNSPAFSDIGCRGNRIARTFFQSERIRPTRYPPKDGSPSFGPMVRIDEPRLYRRAKIAPLKVPALRIMQIVDAPSSLPLFDRSSARKTLLRRSAFGGMDHRPIPISRFGGIVGSAARSTGSIGGTRRDCER